MLLQSIIDKFPISLHQRKILEEGDKCPFSYDTRPQLVSSFNFKFQEQETTIQVS